MIIDISTIIPAVALILYVFFFVFGILQYKRDHFYWSFQLYIIFFAIWSFGSLMMHLNSGLLTPLFWNKVMLVGLLSVPFGLTHFVIDILELYKKRVTVFMSLSYLLLIPLMIFNFTGSIVSDAGFHADGEFYYILAPGSIYAYSISYSYLFLAFIILLVSSKKNPLSPEGKNLFLPLLGVLIMLIGIFMNIFPNIGKYPIDILASTINAILLFYTIYKYKLISYSLLGLKIIYSTIFAIFSSMTFYALFTVIQFFNEDFAPGSTVQLSIILGLVTAMIMFPVRNLLSYLVDSVIIPKRHPYQATILNLSRKMPTILNLEDLAREVTDNLSTGMKSEWVLFIAYDPAQGNQHYRLIANAKCPTTLNKGDIVSFSISDDKKEAIASSQETNSSSVILLSEEELDTFSAKGIPPFNIIIPLIFRHQCAGYILISYDNSTAPLSHVEVDAFELLASQSALALENSLSFEQLRKQGQELELSKNKMEAIFNGIASPVCLIDIDYIIQEANSAALSMFELNRTSLIGKKCYKALFRRVRPCPHCLAVDTLHSGIVQETEAKEKNRIISFQYHNVRVPEESKSLFVEIMQDITEQKHMQEEMIRTEKMAGIGTLAAGIAHEVNNPLAAISGTAEILLSEAKPDSKEKEYLEDILNYAKGASNVIKEMSIYSRAEEREEKQVVQIVETLEFSLRMAMRGSDMQNVEVKRNYHALPSIEANEGEVQQLFLNLIVNAAQSMGGRGILTLSCFEKDGFIHIAIGDTGCGIPEKYMSQVFTPFFTTKPPGAGTGLGLTNCFNIVEKMEGRIRVRSTEGEGSEFTVILPLGDEGKDTIRFVMASDASSLSDVFFIQRKVLVGEKGYLEETIHSKEDERAMHILAFRGIHPVGTVSLMNSDTFWPLPVARYFDISDVLSQGKASEILRLAVLPQMRNTSVSIGLIILVFLLARSQGVQQLVLDVFSDDEKTIRLYRKFGFEEIGTYHSPSQVTVMMLKGKSTLETDMSQLRHFVKPLFKRLRDVFDFGEHTKAIHREMDQILAAEHEVEEADQFA